MGDNNLVVAGTIGSEVAVGNGVFIGNHASVKEGVTISDYAFVGIGTVLLRNVGSHQFVFGNPAKTISL